uniref:SRCR domain-containing protein n=1 Tax=Mola mola TaxID=94237 RepID=A0A3Q3WN89_MOLML
MNNPVDSTSGINDGFDLTVTSRNSENFGKWGYVGDCSWSGNTEKVACRSTHCGEPVSSRLVLLPVKSMVWLNEVNCTGSERSLSDCKFPGWGVSVYQKDTAKKITCSRKDGLSAARTAAPTSVPVDLGRSGHVFPAWKSTKRSPAVSRRRCQSGSDGQRSTQQLLRGGSYLSQWYQPSCLRLRLEPE